MKKIKMKLIILCCVSMSVLFAGMGCKKTFDINQDPNNPSLEVGTPKLVFPVGVMAVAAVEGGQLAIDGGILGEYITQAALSVQYQNIEQYDLKSTDQPRIYRTLYANGLKNLQYVIDKSRESQDWNFYLMGTVMKAYATSILVDLYDQIPYSEALKGASNLTPKFDDGYSIYKSLLADLDSALNQNFSGFNSAGNVDLLFGGDINKWQEFANTLELKMYLRMTNAKPDEAKAGIQALYARNAKFLDEDAKVTGFIDAASESNPMYEQNIRQLNTNSNLRASTTYASFLKSNGDPRMISFFGSISAGSLDQGDYLNPSATAGAAAIFNETPEDPVVFLSEAESYFLQAEARERYFGGDGAKALYNQGVLAAFSSVGKDGSSFIAPGGKYEYPSGTLDQNVEAIITQKWASFPYGVHFIEGWFEKNRTGYPKTSPVYSSDPSYISGEFVVSKNSILSPGKLPKRFVFPDIERSTNPNTPTEVPITTPVWWGK
ncbi:MAG: SusD/RagB family nutrient-binding outer membrane lipoprotein [Ginsengibacter sp.]